MNYLTIDFIIDALLEKGKLPKTITIASLNGDFIQDIGYNTNLYYKVKDFYVESFLYHEENKELVVFLK